MLADGAERITHIRLIRSLFSQGCHQRLLLLDKCKQKIRKSINLSTDEWIWDFKIKPEIIAKNNADVIICLFLGVMKN